MQRVMVYEPEDQVCPSWPHSCITTHNICRAAVKAGCRRIIFASSIHAVSGYPIGYQVHPEDPVNPGDLYGVSKCFGEALLRLIAVQHGVSAIVLRIGSFQSVYYWLRWRVAGCSFGFLLPKLATSDFSKLCRR